MGFHGLFFRLAFFFGHDIQLLIISLFGIVGDATAEILTGEMFGQLGLNAMKPFALPTIAQLFMQR